MPLFAQSNRVETLTEIINLLPITSERIFKASNRLAFTKLIQLSAVDDRVEMLKSSRKPFKRALLVNDGDFENFECLSVSTTLGHQCWWMVL